MKSKKSLLIAIDMDGTITTKSFPKVGQPLPEAFEVMKELQALGHRLILWTCREQPHLAEALEMCQRHGITFVAVNENQVEGFPPLKGRKIFADVYIDDNNLGGFPGWAAVRDILLNQAGEACPPSRQESASGPDSVPQVAQGRSDTGILGLNGHANGNGHGISHGHGHGNGNGNGTARSTIIHENGHAQRRESLFESVLNDKGANGYKHGAPARRTRIVGTLGPATDRPGVLEAVLEAGLNVARINLSHGTPWENCQRVTRLRETARRLGRPVAVLADLPGPKLRAVLHAPMELLPGQEVTLAAAASVTADIYVTEPRPLHNVEPGKFILLDDGRLQLEALRREGDLLFARVHVGGTLLPKKGVNLPDTPLGIPALTERDLEGLAVAAAARVDWLGLSFVRGPEAADELRAAAHAHGLDVPILAKIELPEAVARAQEIIDAFDGVMMDRGDLGVEIPLERVPFLQKKLIALARAAGKPFITATDMLDSMRLNPRPTRAESNDVANAIYDGTDAVMLSGETAAGSFPIEAVGYMDRIARESEAHLGSDGWDVFVPRATLADRITHTACMLAREVYADVIITPTHTGRTAQLVARHRPQALIVAPTPEEKVARQLALVWGVLPILTSKANPGEDWLEIAVHASFHQGAIQEGDLAVGVAGHLVEGGKKAPTIRVVRVGENGTSCAP